MVCIYCGNRTEVINSRLQHRLNQVWRRRRCQSCSAVFSTLEAPDYERALAVSAHKGRLEPFNKDKLLISIYESCKHRPKAIGDASALTQTVTARLRAQTTDGRILRRTIVEVALEVLQNFDKAAATHYGAYHPQQS